MGHKSLIEGFNAFLPKTHHIDPTVAETGVLPPHIIAAAMHSGIAAQLPPHPQMLGKMPASQQPHMPSATQQTINLSHFVNQANMPPNAWNMEQPPHSQGYYGPGPMASYGQPARSEPAKSGIAAAGPSAVPAGGEQKKASPQFNKAFGYVKKIKTRFSNDPETYKAFLAALHSYHKEQMSIHEVYDQVSLLFRDNPDLLAEFMQFLPEQDAAAIINKSAKHMEPSGGPALGRFGDIELKSKRAAAVSVSKAVKRARQATAMLSSYPSTAGYVATHRSPEENEFFDKVKAYLGSKSVYAEFLKCLNLFSQDILKLDDLLRLVNGFIGGNEELYGWFKRYIGLKETSTQAAVAPGEAAHNNWKGTAAGITSEIPELNLNTCKRIGSYRLYPKTHKLVKASGRTALCEEVLNDAMLSCPTFTSEDSTFVGSKKNQYEEALFKCEDERFELDLLIEYNLATIAVFDPIVKRLDAMSSEEKITLQFGNSLGGTSEIIYRKAIRKIYGDKSEEIISGLKRNPAVAMPIVLARLKQKDEEWRRLQRDWNKVWRDVHLKNFYKALDHQGIEFKATDKRNFALRSLISELEAIHQEHSKQRDRDRLVGGPTAATATIPLMGGSSATTSPTANHLEFNIRDTDRLLEDLVRLVKVYLRSTSGGGLTSADRKAVLEFFSTFVPELAWFPRRARMMSSSPRTRLPKTMRTTLTCPLPAYRLPPSRIPTACSSLTTRSLASCDSLKWHWSALTSSASRPSQMSRAPLPKRRQTWSSLFWTFRREKSSLNLAKISTEASCSC
jgi:paired amphipathic helix protein Sin3a